MLAFDRATLSRALTYWAPAMLLAVALKQFYSQAEAAQLQWMLYPLVVLLELASDLSFTQLPNQEWLDQTQHISIVKACAGMNFFIISLLGYCWSQRGGRREPRVYAYALVAAWLTALLANTLRVLLSVYGRDAFAYSGLSEAQTHRLIGIAVYFCCLWAQLAWCAPNSAGAALRVALLLYVGIALVVPLLRAWLLGLEAVRLEHALWVAGVPCAALALTGAWRRLARAHVVSSAQAAAFAQRSGTNAL